MKGSGLAEIVIQSGICASGSIEQVFRGKHYNRALRVHKLMSEALERLLLIKFIDICESHLLQQVHDETAALSKPSKESLQSVLENEACQIMFEQYSVFISKVRDGLLGKTAQLWLYYKETISIVLRFLRATRENYMDLHIACLQQMRPLCFAMDHNNYAKYFTIYFVSLLNANHTHPGVEQLLRDDGFSVSRSNVSNSRIAVDQTIEQTINRHAKSHGGIVGFSRNLQAYYRWCVTRHLRGTYLTEAMENAGMISEEELTHKDVRSSEIIKTENI